MNYSAEEALHIQLPESHGTAMDQAFSVIEKCNPSNIKSLIIQQTNYNGSYSDDRLVIIPETISRFDAVETIKINACITLTLF